jgi:hypothetical protein
MWREVKTVLNLKSRGYIETYVIEGSSINCLRSGHSFSQNGFEIEEIHYFRTGFFYNKCMDMYAVHNKEDNKKGIILSFYEKKIINPLSLFWHR